MKADGAVPLAQEQPAVDGEALPPLALTGESGPWDFWNLTGRLQLDWHGAILGVASAGWVSESVTMTDGFRVRSACGLWEGLCGNKTGRTLDYLSEGVFPKPGG